MQIVVLQVLSRFYSQVVFAKDAVDTKIIEKVKFRLIGPYHGGRVGTVTGVPGDTLT